ncbi:MAG: HAD family phosphatase [Fibrobacterota bacterium]
MKRYLFDIGGVLVNFSIPLLIEKIAAEGRTSTVRVTEVFAHDLTEMVETGRISGPSFFDSYVKPILPQWAYEDWIAAWMDNYSLNEPGMRLLRDIKKAGHPVYILSNLAEYNKTALERKFAGFFNNVKTAFFSYELGLHKPDTAIYHAVASKLGAEANTFVFFDDTPKNVEGAKAAGMQAFLFTNENTAGQQPQPGGSV